MLPVNRIEIAGVSDNQRYKIEQLRAGIRYRIPTEMCSRNSLTGS
jgi:hypothetical protein